MSVVDQAFRPGLQSGQALALYRPLPHSPDPLALHAKLTDRGRRADTFLFERAGGQSLLLDQAALRLESRGGKVTAVALTAGGRSLLDMIEQDLASRITARAEDRIELDFPRCTSEDPVERLASSCPFDVLRFLTRGIVPASPEEPFTIACLGVVSFDHVDFYETLPPAQEDPLDFPDWLFWIAESLILFDEGSPPRAICTAFGSSDPEQGRRAYHGASARLADLVTRAGAPGPEVKPPPVETDSRQAAFPADLGDEEYQDVVRRMKDHIARGDVYQIVPSRTFRAPCADPVAAHAALRTLDRSPYHFLLTARDLVLFGASPETSVRVFRREGAPHVEVKPIAGTRPRGRSPDEDDRLEAEMRLDPKEVAEHMMLVDLARNDVARVSESGTRRVARLLDVELYARVMHLVSSVTGRLRSGMDAFHALQACLNVGTLTGAPKIRATALLRETERTKRGPYGGAIGWVNADGMMDTSVVIRSAIVRDGTAHVRAGAGVVHDSDPAREADETRRKASALLSVLSRSGGEA